MEYKILEGDCREIIKTLPDQSAHCCVTSPPYWGLRNNGDCEGQIGLEESLDEYISSLILVFNEVWRVLRNDGTLWLNLGDCYAGSWGYYSGHNKGKGIQREIINGSKVHSKVLNTLVNIRPPASNQKEIKKKNLIGLPWRVAFALQQQGWYLRSDIIWNKPSCLPESVNDRPTHSHEYIFLLTKSEKYYYDADAIKEKAATFDDTIRDRDSTKLNNTPGRNHMNGLIHNGYSYRNKRSVWTVSTKPFKGSHFSTFPPDLIEPCILAGTSEKGVCSICGKPYERVKELVKNGRNWKETGVKEIGLPGERNYPGGNKRGTPEGSINEIKEYVTVGWKQNCKCELSEPGSAMVLDPFSGAGTTGLVSLKHGRSYTGIELVQGYIDMSHERLRPYAEQQFIKFG